MAQPGFNLIHKTDFPRNRIYDMLVDNDTIVCFGVAYPDSTFSQQGVLLVKFDSSGNYINSNLILDSLGEHLTAYYNYGGLAKGHGGGYALTAATFGRNSSLLIKTDDNLQVEFVKEFEDTVNLSNYRYHIAQKAKDGYLLYGAIQRPNFLDNSFIRNVDGQGNTVWFNYYGHYNQEGAILDLKVIDDSTMIAASVGKYGDIYRSNLRIIDMDGNELDFWVSEPEPAIGYLRKVMVLPNGAGFLTYGLFPAEIINDQNRLSLPALARFNNDLEIVWIKHLGKKYNLGSLFGFMDIEPTLDGHFVGAGIGKDVLPDGSNISTGWLVKFTEFGDSLWGRYDSGPYPEEFINGHIFNGVGTLSSGNIVAGGMAILGWDENIWLVKVTTDGCMDTILCEPITGIVEQAKKEAAKMKVYPNPASGSVTVELPPGAGQGEILLHNLQGGLVLREAFNNDDPYLQDLSGQAAGVYFMELRTIGGTIGWAKVIVQR
jgi:hypothetical protein